MITVILAGALAVALPQQQRDTTFEVRPGGTVEVDGMHGSVRVGSWERSAIRVRATGPGSRDLEISQRGSEVSIDVDGRRRSENVDFEITVPRSFGVRVDGVNMPATIEGVQGAIEVDNVEGGIIVRNVTGAVSVESVSGSITIDNVRGDVDASSVNQALRLTNVRGNVSAEAVNGSVSMRGIDSRNVDANTVNGYVEYFGTVHDDGHYYLGTHNGLIRMSIPEQANAQISIESANGKVESSFPVSVRGSDGDFDVTVGRGAGARISLESFNGTVYLVRPSGRE